MDVRRAAAALSDPRAAGIRRLHQDPGRGPVPRLRRHARRRHRHDEHGQARRRASRDPRGSAGPRASHASGTSVRRSVDPTSDLAFVRDLVKEVKSEACVDSSRVYAAGFSNGSVLTLALACDGYDEVRRVRGGVRALLERHVPERSAGVDHLLPRHCATRWSRTRVPRPSSARCRPSTTSWRAGRRTTAVRPPSATTTVSRHVRHFAWKACRAGSDVNVYVVDNGGHRWPGGKPISVGTRLRRHDAGDRRQHADLAILRTARRWWTIGA